MGLDVVNEAIGAGVVPTSRLVSLQLRLDDLGQLFAKFNTVFEHMMVGRYMGFASTATTDWETTLSTNSILTPTDHRN